METPGARDGIGDTSLGITSLLALAWQRSRDPRLVEPVRSSLGFHLRERVFRYDNPGYPNLRIRDSGEPYARYALGDGEHPIGDVTGGLMLTRRLLPEAAGTVRETTVCRYAEELRARRLPDRGGLLPVEHGGAYDNNYGPISLSFLAQAHRVRDTAASGLVAKLVTKPVVTRDHGLPHTRSLYVTDGTRLWLTVTLGRAEGSRICRPGCHTWRKPTGVTGRSPRSGAWTWPRRAPAAPLTEAWSPPAWPSPPPEPCP